MLACISVSANRTVDDAIFAQFSIASYGDQGVQENTAYTSPAATTVGSPALPIVYSLSGADAARFTIDASTGVVSMVARNFEDPEDADTNNLYSVVVTATDNDGDTATRDLDVVVFNDCSNNDTEPTVKLSAPDALGDTNGDTVTLQVEVLGAGGTPRSGVAVGFTRTAGSATPATGTGVTNGSGIAELTVSSSSVGTSTYTATYDTTGDSNPNATVPLGSPINVQFAADISSFSTDGMVGIGTETPDGSTVLEVSGTDRGVLVPRVALLSTTDVATIPTPAVSLLVYNTNAGATGLDEGFVYWTGSVWRSVCDQ
ncbi:MAG: cadherin repeat domain-containing protein [Nonlabens sp.]